MFPRFEVSETPTGMSGTKGSYENKNIKSPLFEVKKKFGNGSYLMRGSQNLNSSLVFSMEPDCFFIGPLAPLAAHTWNCQHHLLVASGDCKLLLHEQNKLGRWRGKRTGGLQPLKWGVL